MPDSIDASDAMIDNWTKRLEENAARYKALADRVQGQSVTERSKDGTVTVTVDSRGLLRNLVIPRPPPASGWPRCRAGDAARAARAGPDPELLQQAMSETTGTGDQAAAEIVREAQSTFPQPPPEPEPAFPEPDRVRRFLRRTTTSSRRPRRRAPRRRRRSRNRRGAGVRPTTTMTTTSADRSCPEGEP